MQFYVSGKRLIQGYFTGTEASLQPWRVNELYNTNYLAIKQLLTNKQDATKPHDYIFHRILCSLQPPRLYQVRNSCKFTWSGDDLNCNFLYAESLGLEGALVLSIHMCTSVVINVFTGLWCSTKITDFHLLSSISIGWGIGSIYFASITFISWYFSFCVFLLCWLLF